MEKILLLQNPHWTAQPTPKLTPRDNLPKAIKLLELKEMLVVTGVRRSGKSTLFKQLIAHLCSSARDAKRILYLNLDDPFFSRVNTDATSFYDFIDQAERLTNTRIDYLFLDEVQNITAWEKFAKSVYDASRFKKIFITGSNSNLLDSEYTTLLSGRYTSLSMQPLSFKECLYSQSIQTPLDMIDQKHHVMSTFDDILKFGSFPEAYRHQDKELKQTILKNYYETILLKDCIARADINRPKLMQELAYYLITNLAAPYTYNSLSKNFSSNEHTIKHYLSCIEEAYLFEELKPFAFSLNKQTQGYKKCYCVDNGLISAVAFTFWDNIGKLFENLIYTELKKAGYQELYLFKDKHECDFIGKQGPELTAIQVTYQLDNQSKKREINGLLNAIDKTKAKQAYIITLDQELQSDDERYSIVPFWKFFGAGQPNNT